MGGLCAPDPGRLASQSILRPGLSIGDEGGTIGTLGLFVVDASQTLCLLSARHILAPSPSQALRPILHPARPDQPAARRVASLWWWSPRLDAALARIERDVDCSAGAMETGEVVRSFRPPVVGDVLEKSGRSSGITRARVTEVDRPADGLPSAFILERLSGDAEPISCDGDSGAVWYDPATGEGVGLHHGGEPEKGKAVAVSLVLIKAVWDIEPWNGDFVDGPEGPA